MKTTHRILLDDEYLKVAQRLVLAQSPITRPLYLNRIRWPARIILAGCVAYTIANGDVVDASIFGSFLALSFFASILSRRSLSKAREKNRMKDTVTTFSMDDQGVDSVTTLSNAHVKWPGILAARIYPQGVLLKMSPRGYAWLPDQSLTEGAATDVRELLANHVKDCATGKL